MAPRTAQAALRHSSLDLTMLAHRGGSVYTDSSLLDVAGALAALLRLSFDESTGRSVRTNAGT